MMNLGPISADPAKILCLNGALGAAYWGVVSRYSLLGKSSPALQMGAFALSALYQSHHSSQQLDFRHMDVVYPFCAVCLGGFLSYLDWKVNLLTSTVLGSLQALISNFALNSPQPNSPEGTLPLSSETGESGDYTTQIGNATLALVKGDMLKQEVEAIVNAAQQPLLGGGGVDGAVHNRAGHKLKEECEKLPEIDPKTGEQKSGTNCRILVGDAVVTHSYDIQKTTPSIKHVVHTVGPLGTDANRKELLKRAYQNSLRVADEKGIKSIAFPAISAGIFGYPTEECQQVALEAVVDYLRNFPDQFQKVLLVYLGEGQQGQEIYSAAQKAWKEIFEADAS